MSLIIEKIQYLFESCRKKSGTAAFELVPEAAHALINPMKEQELSLCVCNNAMLQPVTQGWLSWQSLASSIFRQSTDHSPSFSVIISLALSTLACVEVTHAPPCSGI